jgi:hypothetical protein
MPPPPRKPIPGIPSALVWSEPPPRAATRSHPGTETSDRPAGELPSTPPPSARQSGSNRIGAWFAGGALLITALGGVEFVKAVLAKPTVSPEQIVKVAQDSEARDRRILDYLEGQADDQDRRDAITIAVLCAISGGPPARDINCPVNACMAVPNGQHGPACKVDSDWPKRRRP